MKDHLYGHRHREVDPGLAAGYADPEPDLISDPAGHLERGARGSGRHVPSWPGEELDDHPSWPGRQWDDRGSLDGWEGEPAYAPDPYGDGEPDPYGDEEYDEDEVAYDDPVYGHAGDGYDDLDDLEYEPLWTDEDEDEAPGPPVRRRPRGARRSPSGSRAARRRTTTLLNGSTMAIFAIIGAGGAGLTALIVLGRLLTTRQLFFMTHASLGILITHAFGGGLGTLCTTRETRLKEFVRKISTVGMAVIAWLACVVGTWGGYAGYRAKPPPGSGNLQLYPREYLLATPGFRFWETFAMEWKVHVGWITPFLATAVAFVVLRYGRLLVRDLQVRKMLTNLFIIAFAAAVVASMLGAVVNTVAPNDFMHRGWEP